MNKSKMSLIFILMLSIVLSGCASTDTIPVQAATPVVNNQEHLSKILALSDWVTFLDKTMADELLVMEGAYIVGLRESEKKYYFHDVIVPVEDDAKDDAKSKDAKENKKDDAKKNSDKKSKEKSTRTTTNVIDYKHLAREWNLNEQDEIRRLVLKFEDAFSESGCSFETSVPMVKILGHSRLPKVFVLDSCVVISEDAFDMIEDELETELIKACFGYYLNTHPKKKEQLIEICGYTALENISVPEVFANHIIVRPEYYKPYVIKGVRTDIEDAVEESWIPMTFINQKDKTLSDYMVLANNFQDGKAVISEVKNANLYLPDLKFMEKYVAVSPNVIKGKVIDYTHCKDSVHRDDTKVHPEDILCEAFEQMISERGDQDRDVIQILRNTIK